jgi:GntR family transcriptional regulator
MPRAVARHRRVAADVERRIAAGEWLPGDPLPSRRDLAARYGVHEQTIRLVVNLLRQRGVIESQGAGRPVEVAHTPVVRTLIDPDEPWPWRAETTARGRMAATDDLAERLGINPGLQVQWESEERLDPAGRSSMWVSTWWRGRRRPYVSVTAAVDAVLVGREQGAALRLPVDTVALRVVRTRLDGEGVPTETSDLVLPRDRWRIRLR